MLLREHRYLVHVGTYTQILSIHELISGLAGWADRFRLQIPADSYGQAMTIYGRSHEEVARTALDFLTRRNLGQ
jgi:hypothetical protein